MAMKKSYCTIDGRIIGEISGGTRTTYLPDALGSVTATVDETGTKTTQPQRRIPAAKNAIG